MKILGISDITDPLVYSENIVERYGDIDLVISAGDLPVKYYEYIVSSLNKRLYFVFGNHNLETLQYFRKPHCFETLEQAKFDKDRQQHNFGGDYIDGKIVYDKHAQLILGGLGGSMRYNKGEHQFTEFQMALRIIRMLPRLFYNRLRHKRYIDILVTHAAPRGLGDRSDLCHTGFNVFLWFMRRFKPRYLLHGHIHLIDLNESRILHYHQTTIINIYGNYVLEIGGEESDAH